MKRIGLFISLFFVSFRIFCLEPDIISKIISQIGIPVPQNAERQDRTTFQIITPYNNEISGITDYEVRNELVRNIFLNYGSRSLSQIRNLQNDFLDILDELGNPYYENDTYIEWFYQSHSIQYYYLESLGNGFYRLGLRVAIVRFGVGNENISDEIKRNLGISSGRRIYQIFPTTPAQRAGLIVGDIILEMNNVMINTSEDITRIVDQTPSGGTIRVTIIRDGRRRNINVRM